MYLIEHSIHSLTGTETLGCLLGEIALAGDIICLRGDLGAGKTTITQSIARGLGVDAKEYVSSPSFAILHEYQARIPLYHMDLYRLSGADEVIDLGFEEYFYGEGLCVIEWPSRADEIMPSDHLQLSMHHTEGEGRHISISCPETSRWAERLQQITAAIKKND